jgi:hypothetical protein
MLAAIAERTGTVEAPQQPTPTQTKSPATTAERRCLCVIVLASRILVIPLSVRHVLIA